MQVWIIRVSFTLFGAVLGSTIGGFIGGAIGFIVTIILAGIESSIPRPLLRDLFACFVGLTFGLMVASLVIYIVSQATDVINPKLAASIVLPFAYAGTMIVYRRREVFALFSLTTHGLQSKSPTFKILDTSVIIDGRILDICQTGFIDGIVLIPQFVLNELQHIADSSELLRRNKGRRGFEILRLMQSNPDIDVEVTEEDFSEVPEVDAKLIHLAQKTGGKIITNDFNLNKVAELQGVTVLNINELANSVRPVVVAGEVIQVRVLREGKEPNQGVGYLDDGTMVIVEYGRQYVGQTIEVVVTQTLQTTAGRMIFTRAKSDEVDSDEPEDVRSYSRGWQRKPNGASSY
ncbi:MAG: PIN domain-containing protein [Candidatus Poribacteria bacterium]|nr:PIN domain-containing protein [Candidatus Poribacteria bacterium]